MTTADTETPEQAAQRLTDYLFRNGNGDEADRLMLVSEKAPWSREVPRDLGGWSREAIRNILTTAITTTITNAVAEVDIRAAWEASPNRDFSGKVCTECGFDNRFHDELCLFQSPSLRITSKAFNALHDDIANAAAAQKERDIKAEMFGELVEGFDAMHKHLHGQCRHKCTWSDLIARAKEIEP